MNNELSKQTQESISKMKKIHKQLDDFADEILNDTNIPQDLKDGLLEIRKKFKKENEEYEKYLEDNKHRKIIGYNPENFEPIYE